MPEEAAPDTAVIDPEATAAAEEITEVSPDELLERIVAMETNQRTLATELTRAVGRAQSLAARLDKSGGDPQVETKLRGEMASLAELIGTVTDSLPPEVLSADARQRAQQVRDTARRTAQDAEIDRRIAERLPAQPQPDPNQDWVEYANSVEQLITSDIASKGLDHTNPAFNWAVMSQMLRAGNVNGLWQYVAATEAALKATPTATDEEPVVPVRRPRSAPPAAATSGAAEVSVERFLDPATPMIEKLKMLRSSGSYTG